MSRGPGRIERAILACLEADPDNAFTTRELVRRVYGADDAKRHRVAILRAGRRLTERHWWFDYLRGDGLGGELVFFDWRRVKSYGMARLKADLVNKYASRDPRTPPHWIETEADLRATMEPGGKHHHLVAPGGSWARHCEYEWAKASGDADRAAELKAGQERVIAALTAACAGGGRSK